MRIPPVGGTLPRDVVSGETSQRRALARCRVVMAPETAARVATNAVNKGDVLATARVAGINAAKKAAELLPMSHLVLVGNTYINFAIGDTYIDVEASVDTNDRTGVEMEALTAASIAALTIYDMCKNSDRTITIENLALWEKTGGRGGTWRRGEVTEEPEGLV
ncbi:MAG: cyclic pyranopterin monophosphate synthase MoaC [Acidobacteria bacterium]|nr:cyclic pyranopterin monophosphate synthase MoaC [Acidobacteriota bacterium]